MLSVAVYPLECLIVEPAFWQFWYAMGLSEIVFAASLSLGSILFGFGAALSQAKKKDPKGFSSGTTDGVSLALKALTRATIYSLTGVYGLCFIIYKLSGATDIKDFRKKVGRILPNLTESKPDGREWTEELLTLNFK